MKHWITHLCLSAVCLGAASSISAQPETRGRADAATEARSRAQASSEPATTEATPPRQGAGQQAATAGAAAAEQARQSAAEGRARAETAQEARVPPQRAQAPGADEATRNRPELPAQAQQGQSQRQAAGERQAERLDQVHARRMAQLERLRELAIENDQPERISRIDALIEKEQQRVRGPANNDNRANQAQDRNQQPNTNR